MSVVSLKKSGFDHGFFFNNYLLKPKDLSQGSKGSLSGGFVTRIFPLSSLGLQTLPDNTYLIGVVVNKNKCMAEGNYNNNTLTKTLTITTNKDESKTIRASKYKKNWPTLKADLRGTLSVTPYKPNTWAYITLTIHNDLWGKVKDPTGTHIIEVYYIGTKIHPKRPKLKVRKWTFPGPVLPPKSSAKIKQKTDVFTKKYGIYEIVFRLDTANEVIEANEKNNEGKTIYKTE